MALILSIETGTEVCSVALAKDGELVSLRESGGDELGRGQHAGMLGLYVDEVLRENDLDADELDAIAVGQGPGSYTGLRIGVSLAKGMCYALGKPLIAVDSLKALANIVLEERELGIVDFSQPDAQVVLAPMIDARRMEVYTRLFDTELNPLTETEAHIITPESFAAIYAAGNELVVFGNGAEKGLPLLPAGQTQFVKTYSSARGMVALAETAYHLPDRSGFADTAYFEPLYLKDFVAVKGSKKLQNILSSGGA